MKGRTAGQGLSPHVGTDISNKEKKEKKEPIIETANSLTKR